MQPLCCSFAIASRGIARRAWWSRRFFGIEAMSEVILTEEPKQKFPRAAAVNVAREIVNRIRPFTERLLICGSLRRRKMEVGDVEVVYIPLFAPRTDPSDLFGQ